MIETRICAKILLRNSRGQFLVLRRSGTHPRYAHYPDLPGGEVENDDESLLLAVQREVGEETSLAIDVFSAVLLHAHTVLRTEEATPDVMTYLLYLDDIKEDNPQVVVSWEHDRYSWRSAEELTGFEDAFQLKIDYAVKHKLI